MDAAPLLNTFAEISNSPLEGVTDTHEDRTLWTLLNLNRPEVEKNSTPELISGNYNQIDEKEILTQSATMPCSTQYQHPVVSRTGTRTSRSQSSEAQEWQDNSKWNHPSSQFEHRGGNDVGFCTTGSHDGLATSTVIGRTSLHICVERGNLRTLQLLLKREADICATASQGQTLYTMLLLPKVSRL